MLSCEASTSDQTPPALSAMLRAQQPPQMRVASVQILSHVLPLPLLDRSHAVTLQNPCSVRCSNPMPILIESTVIRRSRNIVENNVDGLQAYNNLFFEVLPQFFQASCWEK